MIFSWIEILPFAVSVTYLITESRIFSKVRGQSVFLSCPLCVGFWATLNITLLWESLVTKSSIPFDFAFVYYLIYISCAGSLLSQIFVSGVNKLLDILDDI